MHSDPRIKTALQEDDGYLLGSPWNAYALCLDDALEIGKGWVLAAVKGA